MLRRARSVFLIAFLITSPLSAAFNSTMQWDVRSNGNDVNGGGFDPGVASPGTDFSQQQFSQISYNDIIIGGTTTQGTSVAHPFDSTIPGNVINVTAGTNCTVQRVEVLSVSGVTATFDKSLGTAASTCTGVMGGSLLTVGAAAALIVTGNTVNIKAGTYTVTSAINWPVSTVNSFLVQGYNATHGDGGTKPLITTATNSVNVMVLQSNASGVAEYVFDNVSISSTAGTRGWGFWANGATQRLTVKNSTVDGFSRGFNGDDGASTFFWTPLTIFNTEVKNCATYGIINGYGAGSVQGTLIYDSYFHNNGDAVNLNEGGQLVTLRSIFTANTRGLVATPTAASLYLQNVTVANQTGDGVAWNIGTNSRFLIQNTVFYGNGGWGFNGTGTVNFNAAVIGDHNAYGSNTSGNRNNFPAGTGDVALTASPFVSSTNLALNSTAGGGAAMKTAGFPGVFPAGTSTGYLDIGAVQTSGAPGTGGSFAGAFVQ